jgi:hypothetical protein
VTEALLIGRLIRSLKLYTEAPGFMDEDELKSGVSKHLWAKYYSIRNFDRNFMCASACFFIFISGIDRSTVETHPIIGIHRPYLLDSELKVLSADQVLGFYNDIRRVIRDYISEMGVPQKYCERMFAIEPDKIEWISDDDYSNDLEGLIPELRSWIKIKIATELAKARNDLNKFKNIPDTGDANYKRIKENGITLFSDAVRQLSDPNMSKTYIEHDLQDDAWNKVIYDYSSERPALCALKR